MSNGVLTCNSNSTSTTQATNVDDETDDDLLDKLGDCLQHIGDDQRAILMQQLLSATNAAGMTNGSLATVTATKTGIEDIANRLSHRQNGSSSGGKLYQSESTPTLNGSAAPSEPLLISNQTPSMQLSCVECGITKTNSEDMEVHIKTEHLSWLPFQCPICLSERASDAQMREHLHSSHRKNMNKFIYVDNIVAKRQLQTLMDKALSMSVAKRVNATNASFNGGSMSSPAGRTSSAKAAATASATATKTNNMAADFLQLLDFAQDGSLKLNGKSTTAGVTSSGSSAVKSSRKRPHVAAATCTANADMVAATNTDSLLASIRAAAGQEDDENQMIVDDFSLDGASSALASLFAGANKRAKSEFDDSANSTNDDDLNDDSVLDSLNPISVLDNVAALFGTADRNLDDGPATPSNGKNGKGANVSKKRVLGECSKCQKPVTAGARQMHMFFHLAKDENIFRFRCKFADCCVEHYRKDQMENHQSKAHGKIDSEMMEDRSLELFQKCQELNHELFVAHRGGSSRGMAHIDAQDLSMELLGTKSGSTPGPTAAKAEIAYQAQLAAQKDRSTKRGLNGTTSLFTSPFSFGSGSLYNARATPDDEHPLQCRLCGKTMQNRIRGFHILWHMAKDKGINRYTCKYCDFGHDRSQSVQTHGKKEHNNEDNVEDRIAEYQDDVKDMSEACFGFQALFAQDTRRRSKIPAALAPKDKKVLDETTTALLMLGDASPSTEEYAATHDGSASEGGESPEDEPEEVDEPEPEPEEVEPEPEPEENEENDDEEPEKETSAVKRRRRPFGSRTSKKKPKQKIDEMVALRTISVLLGGAQYYKKKVNEQAYCEKCGKTTNSRMSDHAYTHMEVNLFLCPTCNWGHQSRETVLRHMRDAHGNNSERCIDNRLRHASDIKQTIRECYPAFFIDMDLPSERDVKKIVELSRSSATIAGIDEYLKNLRRKASGGDLSEPSTGGDEDDEETTPFDEDEAAAASVDDEMTRWLKDELQGDEEVEDGIENDVDDDTDGF